MILEKVYDELYGMIEDLKKKVASISGGSTVTITPTLESGTKVADYTIDETSGAIYTPSVNDAIIARFGDICMSRHIVEFTFNNSSSADINVADVLPAGHTIIAVTGSALGGSFAFGFNTAKTIIAAKYTENLNATFTCNLIVYSVAPTRTETKTTKKK